MEATKIDEFLTLVKRRRSIRRFKSTPIPDEYVEKIIEAARWAMSGGNAQPWEFIVVKDATLRNKIASMYIQSREDLYELEKTRIESLRHPQVIAPAVFPPGFKDAPAFIVVCGDRRTFQATVLGTHFIDDGAGPGDTYTKNIANAVHNMHLAAAALGLGSQWVTVTCNWVQSLKTLLDVPELIEVHVIVPVGYPAYEPAPSYRRELEEMVHRDRYDRSKFRSTREVVAFISDLRKRTKPAYPEADLT